MELLSRDKCVNCTACYNVCPKDAIVLEEGELGFQYPIINEKKCVDCGFCKRVCPINNINGYKSPIRCYAAYNKNDNQRMNASSGGAVALLVDYVLQENGLVIGAAFDAHLKLNHIVASTKAEAERIFGSKYIPSNLGEVFSIIKSEIVNRKVLFVGTPCQVAGLKAFLVIDYDNLICVDLVCHGVPSPKLFYKYINELEKKYEDKVIAYNFREKGTGWNTYSNVVSLENNTMKELASENSYMKLFLADVALRESCYDCQFKLGNKYSDITLGDFWGINTFYPEMYDAKGVSAVIVNSQKGKVVFDIIKENLVYKECKIDEIVAGNPSLVGSSTKKKKRALFIKDIESLDIVSLCKKYVKPQRKVIYYIKKLYRMIFKYKIRDYR